jgi:adenosine deaminase
MDSGITCKISADDPINFGNNIEDEYLFLGNELGFTTSELSQVARNGVEVALFECAGKREILSEVVDVFGGN